MGVGPKGGSRVYLDACCIINLFATGRIEEILAALPFHFSVSRYIADHEVLRISTGGAGQPSRLLSLSELAEVGLLTIEDVRSESELAQYVRFAAVLDDGEASVCALAMTHHGTLATDDRKALRVIRQCATPLPSLETPELLYRWSRVNEVPEEEVRRVLSGVRERARFVPRRAAPHYEWWMAHLR